MRRIYLPIIVLALSLTSLTRAGEVTLVKDGVARAVIYAPAAVMAPDTRDPVSYPAMDPEALRRRLRESVRDLALYLGKISGAKIDIVEGAPAPGNADTRVPILIGDLAKDRFGDVGRTYIFKQAFRVVVSTKGSGGGCIGLFGESDLATSYAIYEVLDRLGCRWFMPSDMGEVIPEHKTIALDEMDLKLAPGTAYRGLWYADDEYRRRNRHGGLYLNAGHALEDWITPEQLKAHPDWQATYDGKPSAGRLKWSKPEVANAIADNIVAYLAKYPRPTVSLSPGDGLGFDNSPEDRALDAGDIDETFAEVSITDRLMVICNRVAKRVSAQYPDLLFGVLSYANYVRPPIREKVDPHIVPQIAPITYARAHPMSDDRVPGNKQLRYSIEGWAKAVPMTGFYFYGWFLAEPIAPNPMLTKWGNDVPYVLDKGKCRFWMPETQPNFESSMHALYMSCRVAFDPTLKTKDIFKELNEEFYGHAAPQMTAYWDYIDHIWVDVNDYSGCGFGYMRRWTPGKLAESRRLMDAAIAAAQTPAEKFRVGLANDSLTLFTDFMKLREDQAAGRFTDLAANARAWHKQIQDLGEKYAPQMAFTRDAKNDNLGEGYFVQFYEQTYKDATRIATEDRILFPAPLRIFRYMADPDKKGEAAGYAKPAFDDARWKTTDVCTDTWSTLGYHDYFKSMWYRASVKLPAVTTGKKVYLWLGSTDGSAKVFINGQHVPFVKVTVQPDKTTKSETVDESNGYCTPFSFDITSRIKPGAENQISILCTRMFFNELGTGGLLGPVTVYAEK